MFFCFFLRVVEEEGLSVWLRHTVSSRWNSQHWN